MLIYQSPSSHIIWGNLVLKIHWELLFLQNFHTFIWSLNFVFFHQDPCQNQNPPEHLIWKSFCFCCFKCCRSNYWKKRWNFLVYRKTFEFILNKVVYHQIFFIYLIIVCTFSTKLQEWAIPLSSQTEPTPPASLILPDSTKTVPSESPMWAIRVHEFWKTASYNGKLELIDGFSQRNTGKTAHKIY